MRVVSTRSCPVSPSAISHAQETAGLLASAARGVNTALEALRSAGGLWRIWFEPGATQQYYPILHSLFWVLHRIFGDTTPGYHLVSICLHALSAWLVAVVLRSHQ